MNVTLRQLRVFQSVARTRNFSRTGEAVGLTQPAVSRAIGELEHAMGLRLLDRTTRDVALTEAGRSLAARLVLLDGASGSRRYVDEALARHAVACKVEQELGHPTTAFQMVEAGIGLTVMPRLAVPPAGLPGLAVRPLLPRLERTVMLVRR